MVVSHYCHIFTAVGIYHIKHIKHFCLVHSEIPNFGRWGWFEVAKSEVHKERLSSPWKVWFGDWVSQIWIPQKIKFWGRGNGREVDIYGEWFSDLWPHPSPPPPPTQSVLGITFSFTETSYWKSCLRNRNCKLVHASCFWMAVGEIAVMVKGYHRVYWRDRIDTISYLGSEVCFVVLCLRNQLLFAYDLPEISHL